MPSILLLVPYFGPWPFWMRFFLESCRANADIDWLIIGDHDLPGCPPNVTFRQMGFAAYCKLISQRLGFRFEPANAYKLCDLKPALGVIHGKDIAEYDFWGFSDLDLIYGNLRSHFDSGRLSRYKVLATHERRISGHFCLLRNEPEINKLFWRIPNFKERAQDANNHALDEGAFSRLFLWRKNFPTWLFWLVGRFNPLRRMADFTEAYSTPDVGLPWIGGSADFPLKWYWHNGSLTNDRDGDRTFPYLHFLSWKKHAWKRCAMPDAAALGSIAMSGYWEIDGDGFHPGAQNG